MIGRACKGRDAVDAAMLLTRYVMSSLFLSCRRLDVVAVRRHVERKNTQ